MAKIKTLKQLEQERNDCMLKREICFLLVRNCNERLNMLHQDLSPKDYKLLLQIHHLERTLQ